MLNVLKRNFLLISMFVTLNHSSHCPSSPPGRQLDFKRSLSTANARLFVLLLFSARTLQCLTLSSIIYNHNPIVAWVAQFLVCLRKKIIKKIIDWNPPQL